LTALPDGDYLKSNEMKPDPYTIRLKELEPVTRKTIRIRSLRDYQKYYRAAKELGFVIRLDGMHIYRIS